MTADDKPADNARAEVAHAGDPALERDKLPPEYYEDIRRMNEAARAWYRTHPFAEPRFRIHQFELDMKRAAGRREDENVLIASSLRDVVDKVGVNADARAMLRAMDAAVDGRASYLQAKCLIELAIEAQVERGQGQHAAGTWACLCCGKTLDGYSNLGGGTGAPPPGALSICAYCGALAKVNDAQDGFVHLTADEQRALPPDVRKQIHDVRNAMQKMHAERAKRS